MFVERLTQPSFDYLPLRESPQRPMERNIRRVLLFADVLEEDFDGVSITLNRIIANAPIDRIDYLVVTSHPPKNLDGFPFKIIVCPYIKLPFQKGYRMGLPGRQKDLEQAIDAFGPDLIHFTSPSNFAKFGIKYAQKHKLPVVSIYHTHYPTYVRYYGGAIVHWLLGGIVNRFLSGLYNKTTLTLVPTTVVRGDLEDIGVEKSKMVIWGRAINTELYNPSRRDEGLFNDKKENIGKKVLFVSRLIKEKETATIAKIYSELLKSHPKLTMIIVGDGPERRWLEKEMPDAIFTGKQVGEDLARIYASCDLFFFPSTTETFGNVVLEAMASGLPVVAANAGGPADLVEHGERGYLVEPRNVEEFCDRICQVLYNQELWQQMSKNAVAYAAKHTAEALHEQLWKYYDRAIEEHRLELGSPDELF